MQGDRALSFEPPAEESSVAPAEGGEGGEGGTPRLVPPTDTPPAKGRHALRTAPLEPRTSPQGHTRFPTPAAVL
jgi:hypothetical protein